MRKLKVTQKENAEEISVEVTAQAIEQISIAVKKILAGKLKRETIELLIRDNCPTWVGKKDVTAVLNAIETLGDKHLKPKNK